MSTHSQYTSTITTPATGANAPAPEPKPGDNAERPKWLPEKFKTPEELASSYAELEKKLGQPAAKTEEKPAEKKPEEKPAATTTTTEQKGMDLAKYEAEITKDGKLSDASYAELEKAGVSRQFVDNYVAGQQARGQIVASDIHSVVGGEQPFNNLMQWAAANASEGERAAYNQAVQSGNANAIKLAVAGLQARHTAAFGTNPNLVGGNRPTTTGPKPFVAWSQVTEAMMNKRYDSDPEYRKEIEQRLSVSNI